jgi:hypothetical protein
VVGATVQLYSGATLIDSQTTGAGGCATFTQTGAYTVKVIVSGTQEFSGSKTLNGTTITINLGSSPASIVCCGGYAIPYNLSLTDTIATIALAYVASSSPPLWTGCNPVSIRSSTVTFPGGACTIGTPAVQDINVCYAMTCNSGSSPTFAMTRTWTWVTDVRNPPIYYSQANIGGCSVGCGVPGVCSGSNDSASGSANPTSASPFAISFAMTDNGANTTADPVGGGVGVSA